MNDAEIIDCVGDCEVGDIEITNIQWPIGSRGENGQVNCSEFATNAVMGILNGLGIGHIEWIGVYSMAEALQLVGRPSGSRDDDATPRHQERDFPAYSGRGAGDPSHPPRQIRHQMPMKGCIRRAESDLKRVGASMATAQ